jgi:type 1 glutamine amidotransferase
MIPLDVSGAMNFPGTSPVGRLGLSELEPSDDPDPPGEETVFVRQSHWLTKLQHQLAEEMKFSSPVFLPSSSLAAEFFPVQSGEQCSFRGTAILFRLRSFSPMRRSGSWALVAVVLLGLAVPALAQDKSAAPKKLLLITHSGGFMHDSIGVAEDVLKEKGKEYGFEVTCFRFTNDPTTKVKVKKGTEEVMVPILEKYSNDYRARTGKMVEPENIGRINAETLKKFDAVLFFTTGNPVNKDELNDLMEWVKAGGAFAGTHCATDTLYNNPEYGDMIGAYFRTHPRIQKIRVKLEDPMHPAAAGFTDGMSFEDEIYIFRDTPYDREKLHIIMSVEKESFDPMGKDRKDGDYALSWGKEYGKGKIFYTSLGHRREVWKDERFQKHLFGGLNWAVGKVPGNVTPTGKPK